MATWRKGLRWDKTRGGWVNVSTGRLLTATGVGRRKAQAKRATLERKPGKRKSAKRERKPAKRKRKPAKPRSKRDEVYQRIENMMQTARDMLGDRYAVDYRVHKNKDGTLDSELRVKPKRGQRVNDIFLDMEGATKSVPETWVSTGVRYAPREREEFYIRFRGLSQANSYYQRSTPRKMAANFATGRQINTRLDDKGRRKPEQVIMRLHWNRQGKKPGREQ